MASCHCGMIKQRESKMPQRQMTDKADKIQTRPRQWMTQRYRLGLSLIAGLVIASFILFDQATTYSRSVSHAVNMMAGQRVLAEGAALQLQRMATSSHEDDFNHARDILVIRVDLLEQNHHSLTQTWDGLFWIDTLPDKLEGFLFAPPSNLDLQVKRYVATMRSLADENYQSIRRQSGLVTTLVTDTSQRLGLALDQAVALYQQEGESALDVIGKLQIIMLVGLLSTLLLEIFAIFRPMVTQVEEEIAENERISTALTKSRDVLEEEVAIRTADLNIARMEAEQANIAKSRFLAAAGHDLLQPLEAIGLFAGALERKITDPMQKEIIADVRAAQGSMRRLLNALLDISQIEAGVIELHPVTWSLGPLLDQIIKEQAPLADEKALRLRVIGHNKSVFADRVLTERILRNLISNAVRYTDEGGVIIACRNRGDQIRVEVHDTGPGIAESDMQKIFDEFHQLSDPGRDKSEGLGLGLTISSRLATLMGFDLSVRSSVGRGSVFSLTLPISLPPSS